jgi:hypothetical protein
VGPCACASSGQDGIEPIKYLLDDINALQAVLRPDAKFSSGNLFEAGDAIYQA